MPVTSTVGVQIQRAFAGVILLAVATATRAELITVPGTASTIQGAVQLASAGDRILVAAGRYVERVDLLGKAVILESVAGAAATIIDGDDLGSVLTIESVESGTPVVVGFTITGGAAAFGGGGVRLVDSDAVIVDCSISGNRAAFGGGVYALDAAPVLAGCVLEGNVATSRGGGVYGGSSVLTITACAMRGNTAGDRGGAVHAFGGTTGLRDSVFADNVAGDGGAASLWIGQPAVQRCVFIGNAATAGHGGAIEHVAPPLGVVDSVFTGNTAAGRGGALYSSGVLEPTLVTLFRTRFTANAAGEHGGGVNLEQRVTLLALNASFNGNRAGAAASARGGAVANWDVGSLRTYRNCTFAANVSGGLAGGLFDADPDARGVSNCIVYGNTDGGTDPLGAQLNGGLENVSYSCVEGLRAPARGNIAAEPGFRDAIGLDGEAGTGDEDLRLESGSPCVDAASNAAIPPGVVLDADRRPRFRDDPRTPDTGFGAAPIIDMGAFERQPVPHPCDADVNGDGVVDAADVDAVLDAWDACDRCAADLNGDGVANVDDLILIIAGWGRCG